MKERERVRGRCPEHMVKNECDALFEWQCDLAVMRSRVWPWGGA